MRPHVILHNAVSLDGRLDGFEVDLGLYYEIAGRLGAQAILSGSNTILTGFAASPEADEPPDDSSAAQIDNGADTRPWLVVVDGRGRIEIWERIRRQPYWRGVVALSSTKTPPAALSRQRQAGVDSLVVGRRRVDLAAGLQAVGARYAVNTVRVDSGGRLNAALLRAGLVDEVSLLIHPVLVGAGGRLPLISGRAAGATFASRLGPLTIERERGDVLWVRARVKAEDRIG